MSNLILMRRGTTAQRMAITPQNGELVWDTTEHKLYCGDGATLGGILVTGASGGGLSNITGAYDLEGDGTPAFTALSLSDEMENASINANWTLAGATSTAVDPMATITGIRYDLATRAKGMLVQTTTSAIQEFTMRGAVIGVGEEIIVSISLAQTTNTTRLGHYVRLAVSDSATGPTSGNHYDLTAAHYFSTGILDIDTPGLGVATQNFGAASGRLYLRLTRTATTSFSFMYSQDGTTWSSVSLYTGITPLYTWLSVGCETHSARGASPISCINWIRHITYAGIDPW